MSKKLGQEPTYPTEVDFVGNQMQESFQTGNGQAHYSGMSKRFYAACSAMQGIISNNELRYCLLADCKNLNFNPDKLSPEGYLVKNAYEYADELLKQESCEPSK